MKSIKENPPRDSDPAYTLGVGQEGEARLNILNEIYNRDSQNFLLTSGVKSAKLVLDVGCGTGEMACWIAQQLPHDGKVLAIDYSEQQLSVAKRNAERLGVKNISFLRLSAYNLTDLDQKYDFIFSRFVLAHLKDPEKIINAMHAVLATDGKIVCEDAKTSGHYCFPPSQAFDRYLEIWTKLREHKGADPDFGLKLGDYFHKNLEEVTVKHCETELLEKRHRSIFALNIDECRKDAIESGLTSNEEMNMLRDELTRLSEESPIIHTLRFSTSIEVSAKNTEKSHAITLFSPLKKEEEPTKNSITFANK